MYPRAGLWKYKFLLLFHSQVNFLEVLALSKFGLTRKPFSNLNPLPHSELVNGGIYTKIYVYIINQ